MVVLLSESIDEEFPAPRPPIAPEGATIPEENAAAGDDTGVEEKPEGDEQPVKKLQRGKRSTIRRKDTQEEISAVPEPEGQEPEGKKLKRKAGSTLRKKFASGKSASKNSISSKTSQISEIGPDGVHYKPGFV